MTLGQAVATVEVMRHLILAFILLAACSDNIDPTADLCPGQDRTDECSNRCKPADGSPGEVCAVDQEVACLAECERCNPAEAWCPR